MQSNNAAEDTPVSGRAIVIRAPGDLAIETRQEKREAGQVLVRVHVGGICGSDLHYFQHGGFGAVRLKAPMVLGHELAGEIIEAGPDTGPLKTGQRVAINPSLPCGVCENCRSGMINHCVDMRFYGSAMRWPHVDGGFRDYIACAAQQVVPIADSVSYGHAALAEPLAVCLHALHRAGGIAGKRLLITGSGPIGALMVAVCRHAGAGSITVTDLIDPALEIAKKLGADRTINIAHNNNALRAETDEHGKFDLHFEAAGSAAALLSALGELTPKGISVLIGQGAEIPLQVSSLIGPEIELRGSFRFGPEFAEAVSLLNAGQLKVDQIITASLPADRVREAFELAADKQRSCKVQLRFV